MKHIALAAILAIASCGASAACYGTGAFQTCNDASGNTYNIQRYGNTTNVQGYNPQTGSIWNQSSHTIGNTTQTYGNAANGQAWNSTTISSPSMTQQFGTDSNGRPFNRTCTSFGCN
jgi:hypothetical protein